MAKISNIKLYSFINFDRSSRVRWLLHELALDFEEVRLNFRQKEQYSDHYRSINPISRVPAMHIGEITLFESEAIFSYLLTKYNNHTLIPTTDNDYAEYLSWFFFACSEFDGKVAAAYFPPYVFGADKQEGIKNFNRLKPLLQILNNHLINKNYITANHFSAADIFIASQLGLLNRANLLSEFPELLRYITPFTTMPSAVKAEVFAYK